MYSRNIPEQYTLVYFPQVSISVKLSGIKKISTWRPCHYTEKLPKRRKNWHRFHVIILFFWKKRRPSENGLRFGELPLHSFAVFCLPGFLLHVISGAVVDCCVLYCWYCRLTFFCLFPPLSGLKMAEGSGGCFGGAGQLPEGLLLPCTQVGGQEWRPPPMRLRCIADCCVLLVVVVGGGGSGLWCRMLGLVVCCCFFCFSF